MSLPTKERLAQALHGAACLDLERRARAGEFSDFESEHAMPKVELVKALQNLGSPAALKVASAVMNGDYDDTQEESQTWFQREGKTLIPSNDFQVRNPAVEEQLKDIGDSLRSRMPTGYGFVLLIASYGEGGATFYTSNCERESVIAMMREFIAKHEPN